MVNAGVAAAVVIVAIIASSYGSYYVTVTPLNSEISSYQATVSSYQNNITSYTSNISSYQVVISSMSAHPSTTTVTTTSTRNVTTTSTYTTTYTTLETVTSTTSLYPPSTSSYLLTYVSGNVNQSQAQIQCGYLVLTVDITYEMHQQLSNSIVQWAVFPSGQLMQPTTQNVFTNQAYLEVDSTYHYGTGFCPNDGSISSVTIYVAYANNNQISPSTYFSVQPA